MNDLVVIENGSPVTNSLIIAEKFNKPHADVLKVIRKTISQIPVDFSSSSFFEEKFINSRGREYDCFKMNRDAYSLIVMGFNGKIALDWKIKFIAAFNVMENELLKTHHNLEWKQARLQGLVARKAVTDTIKEFVEYATEQGSKSANMYYSNITKMEYKALELIDKNQKVPSNFRDTLDLMDLSFLNTAEQIAKAAIKEGMETGMHYKEIYIHAKDKVMSFANTVSFARLEK